MRVHTIAVEKLFGRFDHTIALNRNERITILHGPNGFGKTALLRLIHALSARDDATLREIPFDKLSVTFEDGGQLKVQRTEQISDENPAQPRLLLPHRTPNQSNTILECSYSLDDLFRFKYDVPRHWSTQHSIHSSLEAPELTLGEPEPTLLSSLLEAWNVHLVSIQRLLVPRPAEVHDYRIVVHDSHGVSARSAEPATQSFQSAVEVFSNEFRDRLRKVQAQYAQKSQQLERTFPKRLLETSPPGENADQTLQDELSELEHRRSELMDLGLLVRDDSAFEAPTAALDESTRRVLSLYTRDNREKLAVFDDLAARVGLLKETINRHFTYKSLRVDANRGFWFADDDDDDDNNRDLAPNVLSSGEQHQLVMLYEFLFHIDENTLLLIDEPELSLHVSWQVDFLRNMKRIIEVTKFDALIATHSPQIIHDRWDLTVELQHPDADKALEQTG